MPLPIMELMTRAVIVQRPIARTKDTQHPQTTSAQEYTPRDVMNDTNSQPDHLRRAIGRWSLAALMLNTMIGASAFGLPSLLVARLGKWSTLAYFVAAAG